MTQKEFRKLKACDFEEVLDDIDDVFTHNEELLQACKAAVNLILGLPQMSGKLGVLTMLQAAIDKG